VKIRIVDYLRCVSNWDMIHANDVHHHNLLRQIETLIENQWVFSNITGEQTFHAKEYLSVSSTVQQLHFTEYEKVSFDSSELKNKINLLRTSTLNFKMFGFLYSCKPEMRLLNLKSGLFLRRRNSDSPLSARPQPEEAQKWSESFAALMASKCKWI
jgi:hypothetical protein